MRDLRRTIAIGAARGITSYAIENVGRAREALTVAAWR